MRARMALKLANIDVEIREISLRNKPAHMLQVSPKGTVPVLIFSDGSVIDESIEIMLFAFAYLSNCTREKNDPLQANIHAAFRASPEMLLIETNDTSFKKHLDCYKYPERHPDKTQLEYRKLGEVFLAQLENLLRQNTYLFGNTPCMVDYAIFPFIRQFAAVDSAWWQVDSYPRLRAWLVAWLESNVFNSIMTKNPI